MTTSDDEQFINELLDDIEAAPLPEPPRRKWRNLLHDDGAYEPLWNTKVTLFADRWVRAGVAGDRVPLAFVLLDEFPTWAHHAQYVSGNDARLTKNPDNLGERDPKEAEAACNYEGIAFTCIVIDLDHANKDTGDPVPTDGYKRLIVKATKAEHVPNVIAQTNGGAHLYYLLSSPITDTALFEAVHTEMRERTKLWADPLGFLVDDVASDWTRITACAKVVKADESTTYNRHVCALHMDGLQWKALGAKIKKPRNDYTGPGVRKFTGRDGKIRQFLEVVPEERYCALRSVAYYVYSNFHPSQWAELREQLEERAEEIGLPASRYGSALKILNGDH